MPGLAKVGDMGLGICSCHLIPVQYTTVFITGAATVLTNGSPSALVGTIGVATCGHPTIALTGSGTTFATAQPVHRLGDMGQNCGGQYVTITASGNVINSA